MNVVRKARRPRPGSIDQDVFRRRVINILSDQCLPRDELLSVLRYHSATYQKERKACGKNRDSGADFIRAATNVVRGPLSIGELLGSGAHASVYRGKWHGAAAAVRLVIVEMGGVGERLAELKEVSMKLNHPNIVHTYDWTTRKSLSITDGQNTAPCAELKSYSRDCRVHMIVTEMSDLGNLQSTLLDGKLWSPGLEREGDLEPLIGTLLDVANGLGYLHTANLIHGDVRASKILLFADKKSKGFTAKVRISFLSRILPDGCQVVKSLKSGTPAHSAPEYLHEGCLSKSVDVYGFGILMWELFTGQRPYRDNPNVAFANRKQEALGFPPTCPQAYIALSRQCTCESRATRPSMEEVWRRLKQMASGKDVTMRPFKEIFSFVRRRNHFGQPMTRRS